MGSSGGVPAVGSANITDDSIVNADVNSAAAIAQSKIANLTTDLAAKIPKSLIDAAGDLIVGTADDTAGRLAKGSALDVLRVNAGATALEWAAASGGSVSDAAYNEATWDGDTTTAPSKNAMRDKIESLSGASGVAAIVAGANLDVDATDPANPIVSLDTVVTGGAQPPYNSLSLVTDVDLIADGDGANDLVEMVLHAATAGAGGYAELSRASSPNAFAARVDETGVSLGRQTSPKLRVNATGVAFLGAAASPVGEQSITGATEQEQLDSIVAALVAFGLVTDDR